MNCYRIARRTSLASLLLLLLTASACQTSPDNNSRGGAKETGAAGYFDQTSSTGDGKTVAANDYVVLTAKVDVLRENMPQAVTLEWWQRFLTLIDKEARTFVLYVSVGGSKIPLALFSYDEIVGEPTSKTFSQDKPRIKDVFVPSSWQTTPMSFDLSFDRQRDTSYVTDVVKAANGILSMVGPTSGAAAIFSLVGSAKQSEINKANQNLDKMLASRTEVGKPVSVTPEDINAGTLPVLLVYDLPASRTDRKPIIRVTIARTTYPTLYNAKTTSPKLSFQGVDARFLTLQKVFEVGTPPALEMVSPRKYLDIVNAPWREKLTVPTSEAASDVCNGVFDTFSSLTQRDVAITLWAFYKGHPGANKPVTGFGPPCPSDEIIKEMAGVDLSLPTVLASVTQVGENWGGQKTRMEAFGTHLKGRKSVERFLAPQVVIWQFPLRAGKSILEGMTDDNATFTAAELDKMLSASKVSSFGDYDKNARNLSNPTATIVINGKTAKAIIQYNGDNLIDRIDLKELPPS
ncbi:MAG: hypothetical protein HY055_05630 [Magnetospirillum sp.]|nr:hypothetical protein [Magnetospirillum sp.]